MSSAQTICDAGHVRALRYRYLWLFGGVCLIGLVLYVTLMPPRPGAIYLHDKMAHGIAFLALMIWFCGVFEMRFAPLVAAALLCLGIGIELAQQQLTYRAAELADALADTAGIGIGWVSALAGLQRWTALIEAWIAPDRS